MNLGQSVSLRRTVMAFLADNTDHAYDAKTIAARLDWSLGGVRRCLVELASERRIHAEYAQRCRGGRANFYRIGEKPVTPAVDPFAALMAMQRAASEAGALRTRGVA